MIIENVKKHPGRIVLLASLLLACGCATVARSKHDLHRLKDERPMPKDARIGLTLFTSCGGSYLDKLNPEYHQQDAKARFYLTCTSVGHPQAFSQRLQQRLEERFGRKLVLLRTDKPFKPKQVLNQADRLGLDYVIGGDLLYMGQKNNRSVVSAALYLIRVADAKIVVVGRVNKEGPIGQAQKTIDAVADDLFRTSVEE